MKYPLYIFCLLILYSCKSRRAFVAPDYEIITEYIAFDCHDSTTCVNTKYNLTKRYNSTHELELWNGNMMFLKIKTDKKHVICEAYKSTFLLISTFPKQAAGLYTTERDTVIVYDIKNEKSYNLLAKRYILAPFKTTPPRFNEAIIKKLKIENVTLHATIDTIDVANNQMVLLLGDSKTRDTVVLQLVN